MAKKPSYERKLAQIGDEFLSGKITKASYDFEREALVAKHFARKTMR